MTSETSLQEKAQMLKHWRAVADAADNPQLLEPGARDADADEDGATSLQSLLAAMQEGQPIDLSTLSEAQLRQLHQHASSLVRIRTPWWDMSSGGAGGAQLGELSDGEIEPEEDEDEEEEEGGGGVHVVAVSLRSDLPRFHAQMRQILEAYVPDLASLTSAAPSEQMVWHLVALLFGYVIVMRYTNMDWLDDPADALEALVMSSPAFQSEFRAAAAVDVVEACIKHVCDYVTAGSDRMPLLNDVRAILADEMMLAYAIMDAWALATTAAADRPAKDMMQALKLSCTGRMPQPTAVGPLLRDFATQFRSRPKGRPSPAQLAQRKLYYMLCSVKQLVLGESQLLEDSIAQFTRYLAELAVLHQESR